jgi:hypothetical protein
VSGTAVLSYLALRLFIPLALSLTIANLLAVGFGWMLSIVVLPALAGAILASYMNATSRAPWLGTAVSNLLLAWVITVMIMVGFIAWFVYSKNGKLEREFVSALGKQGLGAILAGSAAGLIALLVVGRIARLLSRGEAA